MLPAQAESLTSEFKEYNKEERFPALLLIVYKLIFSRMSGFDILCLYGLNVYY